MRATPRRVAAAASLFAACVLSLAHAPSSAFVAPPHAVVDASRGDTSRLHLRLVSASESPAIDEAPLLVKPPFRIREATYADLGQAADLMTDGFYPTLQTNPLLRPIRYFLELDRLQGNFPYDVDGRHYYLAAYNDEGEVVGFCDIDGRIPQAGANGGGGMSLLPFATKRVNRPQPYFSDLAVHPKYRRQGIASALMEEAEVRARRMGFEELYLGVRSTNDVALGMYSRMGYELIVPTGDMLAFLEVQREVRMLRRSLGPLEDRR